MSTVSNIYLNLPAGAPGAAVDTSQLGEMKTITADGLTEIQFSTDGVTFAPLTSFGVTGGTVTLAVAATAMRQSGGANVDVAANNQGTLTAAVAIPAGNGFGPVLDVSTHGGFSSFVVAGLVSGNIIIQISEDNIDFIDLMTFSGQGGTPLGKSARFTAAFVRVKRQNAVGTISASMASTTDQPFVDAFIETAFVLRPKATGPQANNVFTSASEVVTAAEFQPLIDAMAATPGPKTLHFDGSLCTIPFPGYIQLPAGTWDFHEVLWQAWPWADNYGAPAFRVEVHLPEGFVATRFRAVTGPIIVVSDATVTPIVSDWTDPLAGTTFAFGAMGQSGITFIRSDNTAPFFLVPAGNSAFLEPQQAARLGKLPGGVAAAPLRIEPGGFCQIFATTYSNVLSDTIDCAVGGSFDLWMADYCNFSQQTLLLGTFTFATMEGKFRYQLNPRPFNPVTPPSAVAVTTNLSSGQLIRLAPLAPITQRLPSIGAVPGGVTWGRHMAIKNTGTAIVTVLPSVADVGLGVTIDGAASTVVLPGSMRVFISEGASNWITETDGLLASQIAFSGQLSPAALALGATQDYDPAGLAGASALRLTADGGGSALGGLAGGTPGRLITLFNIAGGALTINDEDAGSAAANRFALTGAIVIPTDGSATFLYDGVSLRWRCIGTSL
jgi:hypothetical protein